MASNLVFKPQLVSPGVVIPIEADRAQGSTLTSVKVDVSISDKVVNLIGTTMKTVTLNYNDTSAKFEGLLTIEYGEIPGTNYASDFEIGGTIRGSNEFVLDTPDVYYMSQVKDVKIDTVVPGNGSITLLCSHDGSVENDLNTLAATNNSYIRTSKISGLVHTNTHVVGTLLVDTKQYSDSRKHYTITLGGLTNETEYEIGLTMVNAVGPTTASLSVTAKPSLYPNALTFETFNSLDASGGRFNVSLDNQSATLSSFKSLRLKVSYTSAQVTVPATVQTIDLSGSYPNVSGAKRTVEFLMPAPIKTALLAGSAFNKFAVNAYLEADISGTDISGAPIKTLAGLIVSQSYFMDRPLTVSSFSLDAVNWSDGAQTLKASILGGTDISYSAVTATFDISGSIAAAPIVDLCNNVTSAKVAITYAELNVAKLSVKPTVVMSRKELNNAAVTNTSAKFELAHVLSALKQGAAPSVTFTPLPTEVTKLATFKFAPATGAIADLSSNTFYRVQLDEIGATTISTIQDKITKSVSQMTASGETFTLTSSTIAAGMKSLLRAFTILDLSKYASAYAALNKNQRYLSSAEANTSVVFKGTPDVSLSLRPSTAAVEKLDTIRVSGNLKANNLDNMYVFGQDICGRVIFKSIDITAATRDICGRMMTHDGIQAGATNDFAGPFTFDIPFNNTELPLSFSVDPVYLHAVLDTPDDVDKVVIRTTTSAVETEFAAKVAATYSVETAYQAALDLSMNPTRDVQYQVIDASSAALASTITDLSMNIDLSYSGFSAFPLLRDSSNNGGKWFFDQKLAAYNAAKKAKADIHEHNLTQVLNKSTFAYDAHDTYIIMNWRDASTNSLGYVTSVKAFNDPSNVNIWGISSAYPEYNNIDTPGSYNTGRAFRSALALANDAVAAAQTLVETTEVDEENALAAYNNTLSKIANFSASVKVMEDRLAGLKTQQAAYTAAKQSRVTALVAAAATAKLARDSAASNLAKARLAFFDASGNVLA
jgi:hypothetical protein